MGKIRGDSINIEVLKTHITSQFEILYMLRVLCLPPPHECEVHTKRSAIMHFALDELTSY